MASEPPEVFYGRTDKKLKKHHNLPLPTHLNCERDYILPIPAMSMPVKVVFTRLDELGEVVL